MKKYELKRCFAVLLSLALMLTGLSVPVTAEENTLPETGNVSAESEEAAAEQDGTEPEESEGDVIIEDGPGSDESDPDELTVSEIVEQLEPAPEPEESAEETAEEPAAETYEENAPEQETEEEEETVSPQADEGSSAVSVSFTNKNGETETKDCILLDGTNNTLGAGWYAVQGAVSFSSGLTVTGGEVSLILTDNCTLTVSDGIYVQLGASLSVYAQSVNDINKQGRLIAEGGSGKAGIGGIEDNSSGDIYIYGGYITATGGSSAAGIGGGQDAMAGYIGIVRGTVKATGKGIYTGTVKKTFRINPLTYTGNESQFDIKVDDAKYSKGGAIPEVSITWNGHTLAQGTDYTLKYTGNKKVGEDTAKVLITFRGNYKGSESALYSITAKDLSEVNMTAKDLVYRKGKYQSTPVLTDSDGKKLAAGTDYDKNFEYTADIVEGDVAAGSEVTVTVHAKDGGNYTGFKSCTYKILAPENNLSSAAVQFKDKAGNTVKSLTKDYTGEEVTLSKDELVVTMKVKENGKTVTVTVDPENYEIEGYTNNVNKGTAKAVIRGTGEYGGEKTISFKIGMRSIADVWNGVKQLLGRF